MHFQAATVVNHSLLGDLTPFRPATSSFRTDDWTGKEQPTYRQAYAACRRPLRSSQLPLGGLGTSMLAGSLQDFSRFWSDFGALF